ncbi:MAG: hypothetical protein HY079_03385 [Elusimicrobia bacterium]|nr:hypothetical protein [Elusimicrobiota bacterium]
MRTAIFSGLLLAAAVPAAAQSTATLRGIDVYRSSALTEADARKRFEPRLKQFVGFKNQRLPGGDEKAEALRVEMQKEAAGIPGVKWVDLHASEYFTSVDHAMYAIFDVVDAADASRLAFAPEPKAKIPDPDGVLAAWRAYVAKGELLSRRGEMPLDRPACPGFYCLWGGTPELDSAQQAFVKAAKEKSEGLKRVLRADENGEDRADALFVLAYSESGAEVASLCHEALLDADARVRGAALQILADIANHHPEQAIALDHVLPRLDDPAASVRGKAMGLLVPLAEKDAYRPAMLTAAPRLAVLLRLSQPESRDLAFTLLGLLSKKSFDRNDLSAWYAWAAKAAAGKP